MIMFKLQYFIIFAGCWSLGNGVLHDIFVLRERRPFERELIRLLIDGHILIFAGIVFLLSADGLREQHAASYFIAGTTAIFLLGYCALIFKILPSFITIVINLIVLIWLVVDYLKV